MTEHDLLDQIDRLRQVIRVLERELEEVRAERDVLLAERRAAG